MNSRIIYFDPDFNLHSAESYITSNFDFYYRLDRFTEEAELITWNAGDCEVSQILDSKLINKLKILSRI